jgi:hypothetical protein
VIASLYRLLRNTHQFDFVDRGVLRSKLRTDQCLASIQLNFLSNAKRGLIAVDPQRIEHILGLGVLALAFFVRGTSNRVRGYARRRRSRKKEARALRARLKELRA